jgi:undecaprenyl-diphosphatase
LGRNDRHHMPVGPHIAAMAKRLWHEELSFLILLLLLVGLVWAFTEIADEVVEGETHALDRRLILAMRDPQDSKNPLGPKWFEEMGRDFTALGGNGVLTFLTLSVVGYLLLKRRFRTAALVIVAIGGGTLLSYLLKIGFGRPRPDLVPHGSYVYTASFPSGHSMMSAVTYLTLGALLARIHPERRIKVYILIISVLTTLAVGISRVYMGVHWPTDVLGGWTLGASWALLCWLVMRVLQIHGHINPENPADEDTDAGPA